jgi:uncharacterized delta-60 repeat protein
MVINGGNFLYESSNRGDDVAQLGPGPPMDPANAVGVVNSCVPYAMRAAWAYGGSAVGVPNPEVLYVGCGGVLRVRTTGNGLPRIVTTYPGGCIRSISLDPYDWRRAYILDSAGRVWRTTNAGLTTAAWVEVTGNLAALGIDPRIIIAVSPMPVAGQEALVVGGLGGLAFASDPRVAAQTAWRPLGDNFPNVIVADLQYDANDDVLVAGTVGRGAWKMKNARALLSAGRAGALDPTFDLDGKATTDFGAGQFTVDSGRGVAIQSDGKIVVVGKAGGDWRGTGDDFGIARFNPDGVTLDSSFAGGIVRTDFGNSDDEEAHAVTIQRDGKILVAGKANRYILDAGEFAAFAVARYNPDGSLDTGFSGGRVLIPFDTPAHYVNAWANAITVRSNGLILVAGVADGRDTSQTGDDFAIVQLNDDGTLDTSFGAAQTGKVQLDFSHGNDSATSVALQADGRVVVAGSAVTFTAGIGNSNFGWVRLSPDGLLESIAAYDFYGGEDVCNGLAITRDGKMVLGGYATSPRGDRDFALLRLNADGTLDTAFGSNGKAVADFGTSGDEGHALAVQSDGKIVLAGSSDCCYFGLTDFAMARFTASGSLDGSFGLESNGRQTIRFSSGVLANESANALILDGDGRLIVAGTAGLFGGGSDDFAVARVTPGRYPHLGEPLAVPGTIFARDYDNGGPNVAYADTSVNLNEASGLFRSTYRPGSGVDLEYGPLSFPVSPQHAGYVHAGEWLEYTVQVGVTCDYSLQTRVASAGTGGTFHLQIDGVGVTGTLSIPDTGGWLNFQNVSGGTVGLTAGTHVLGIQFDTVGANGVFVGNLESLQLDATCPIVSSTADSGPGSLRQAILDANNSQSYKLIGFNIAGKTTYTIAPLSPLPPITAPVTIDGYTQPGSSPNTLLQGDNAVIRIELNGANAGPGANGLTLATSNCAVRGLVINRFSGNGIAIQTGGSNTITGNFIGTDASGSVALGNVGNGVYAETADNLIGGTNPSDRNVISGNGYAGIQLQGTASSNNVIAGNLIGTDATGTSALANTNYGILVFRAAANQIGGGTPAARNVVSGNGYAGVVLGTYASNNLVQGNYAGLGADGVTPVSNAVYGIYLSSASFNLIRSNVSSENYLGCHVIYDGSNIFQGNFIGTDASGTLARGNAHGMSFQYSAGNLIGGTSTSERNLISGNRGHGIVIGYAQTSNNIISGNFIGADVTGANPLGNGWAGITMSDSPNNSIGGAAPGAGNLIRGNGWQGISLYGNGATNNFILGNRISGNGLLGIDLNGDGVTLNHPGGAVPGPNNLQNFPLLTLVTSGTESIVAGTLDSAANTLYRVEFFASHVAPVSGYGQGETFIEQTNVVTDMSGHASFRLGLVSPIPYGQFLTATCTDPLGNTSEFSRALQSSQAGTLDTTFNSSGQLTLDLGFQDTAQKVVIQPDGKIVIVGNAGLVGGTGGGLGVVRLNPDGALDSTFGNGGIVRIEFGGCPYDFAAAVALQPDAKIVLAGAIFRDAQAVTSPTFALARLYADGSLDTNFNGTGKRVITFDAPGRPVDSVANAVALRPNGKILVVGTALASQTTNSDFALAQLNPDGSLDTAFGLDQTGLVQTDLSTRGDSALAVALPPDGRAIVAGASASAGVVARYDTDGRLESTTDLNLNRGGYYGAVGVLSDGKILLAGAANSLDGDSDFALVRLQPDLSLDTTFGNGGITTLDLGGHSQDYCYDMAVQTDGKIVLVGSTDHSPADFALARFRTDGALDLDFGPEGTGIVLTPFGASGNPASANAVALDGDGRIVVVGAAYVLDDDFAVARYYPGEYPVRGAAWPIPGRIEAEDYDNGGPEVAYFDTTINLNDATGAYQSNYRPGSGVDLETDSDGGNNVHVAYVRAGEWLQYTVNVAGSGFYNVQARVASAGTGGTFHLELDGVDKTGPMAIPDTGGWLAFQTITNPGVLLPSGLHSLRVVFDGNGANGVFVGNLNYLTIAGVPVAQPALRIRLAGNQIVISWPTSALGFVLQSVPSLLPPGMWTDVPQTPVIAGSEYTVVLPRGTGQQFFRLVNH